MNNSYVIFPSILFQIDRRRMMSVLKVISRLSSVYLTPAVCRSTSLNIAARHTSTLMNTCQQLLIPKTVTVSQQGSSVNPFCLPLIQQCRTYKVRSSVKLRCSSCYFVRRQGRLFVECTSKPRHKQMQQIARKNIFKDDYTIGSEAAVRKACFYKYQHNRHYEQGHNQYSRHNWLEGKLGQSIWCSLGWAFQQQRNGQLRILADRKEYNHHVPGVSKMRNKLCEIMK